MLSVRNFTGANVLSSHPPPQHSLSVLSNRVLLHGRNFSRVSCCCLKVQEAAALSINEVPLLESGSSVRQVFKVEECIDRNEQVPENREKEEEEEGENKGISKIRVPRHKYIPVSKAQLSDAIVSNLFESKDEVNQFRLLCSCLDSILHAEHKSILEEMREDYFLSNAVDNEGTSDEEVNSLNGQNVINGADNGSVSNAVNGTESSGRIEEDMTVDMPFYFNYNLDLRSLLESLAKDYKKGNSRVGVATRFQRSFMQLLDNAQFQELSASDLILTSALNSDYLLTLPIYIDWKKASESNAIIFRRGYATERQKGLLLVEKLDYLQSRLLQRIFYLISRPVGKVGKWMKEAVQNTSQTQEVQDWVKRMAVWLEDSYFNAEKPSENFLEIDQISDKELPIWLAAQKAVSRYEGFLSTVGPRGRLFKKLLRWIGLAPPLPETPYEEENDSSASEPHLRPIFLSRISLSDIWRPASRKYCGNNLWKMVKTSFSILLSKSILQEPAFEELILLYTKELSEKDIKDKAEVPSLQLKIYERIPIPDLPVVFPDKKLSFRILDTVRLDVATILGLLAYFINYKFEDILASPSAVLLDVVAVTALIIYVSRVALGYKQTWDRYQLLVNKTLYEKTLASGFGSVHFLLDASEQQQYKEAILTYAILLKVKNNKDNCRRGIGDACERFMYEVFKLKVEMPVDKAMNTLLRLGLVKQTFSDERMSLQAIPCREAHEELKARWNSLLG